MDTGGGETAVKLSAIGSGRTAGMKSNVYPASATMYNFEEVMDALRPSNASILAAIEAGVSGVGPETSTSTAYRWISPVAVFVTRM